MSLSEANGQVHFGIARVFVIILVHFVGVHAARSGRDRRNPKPPDPSRIGANYSATDAFIVGRGNRHSVGKVLVPRAQLLPKLLRHVPASHDKGIGTSVRRT